MSGGSGRPSSRGLRALVDIARRALPVALVVALATGIVFAQDPRTTPAQRAAREWLALTDKEGGGALAWKAAAPRFQQAMPMMQWTTQLRRQREPRGAVLQRTIADTTFRTQSSGLPDGNYATVSFRTSFAKETSGIEQVTLEQGSDGAWRVIGYMIR